jgi:hypothetical protein
MAAFIAGGSLLLFLPAVPEYWGWMSSATIIVSLLGVYLNRQSIRYRNTSSVLLAMIQPNYQQLFV